MLSAKIVSRLRISSGTKLEVRSQGVSTDIVPKEVPTSLLV